MTTETGMAVFSRQGVRHEMARRSLVVRVIEDLTPSIRRVTFSSDDLKTANSPGPDDHIKLQFPTRDGDVVGRDFTPRALRPGRGELDVDFVLHANPGPASAWASDATVGSSLGMGGPKGSRLAPAGIDAAVLVADPTALPAVGRWLEALPEEVNVHFIAATDTATASTYLGGLLTDRVHLQTCRSASEVAAAVEATPVGERTFCWAAGEASILVPVRRYWRRSLGLPPAQAVVSGYWREGVGGADHHAPVDPSDPD